MASFEKLDHCCDAQSGILAQEEKQYQQSEDPQLTDMSCRVYFPSLGYLLISLWWFIYETE